LMHKRGDTFDYSGVLRNGGQVEDFTGWTLAAEIRQQSSLTLVATLQATWVDAETGLLRLRATNTTSWRPGRAVMDVQFTTPTGDIVSSPTVPLVIVQDTTI